MLWFPDNWNPGVCQTKTRRPDKDLISETEIKISDKKQAEAQISNNAKQSQLEGVVVVVFL